MVGEEAGLRGGGGCRGEGETDVWAGHGSWR